MRNKKNLPPLAESDADRQLKPPRRRRLRRQAGQTSLPGRISRPLASVLLTILHPIYKGGRAAARPLGVRPVRALGKFLGRLLMIGRLAGAWRELRQVQWPDRRQTARLTIAVFVFAVFFGLLITTVDFGFEQVVKRVLLK